MGVVSAGLVRIKQISRGCPEALCTEIMESHVGCSVQRSGFRVSGPRQPRH